MHHIRHMGLHIRKRELRITSNYPQASPQHDLNILLGIVCKDKQYLACFACFDEPNSEELNGKRERIPTLLGRKLNPQRWSPLLQACQSKVRSGSIIPSYYIIFYIPHCDTSMLT